MTESEIQYLEEPAGAKYKLLLLFNILVCCFLMVGLVWWMGGDLIDNYFKVQNQASYLSVSKWALPSLINAFGITALLYILLMRLCKRLTQQRLDNAMKYFVYITVVFILSRLIYGFVLTNYLENNGYSHCYYYSSPSVMGNSTWLRDPAFCLELLTAHSSELQEWFDKQDADGKVLTLDYVQQETSKLDQAERAKYPSLYD